MNRNLHQLVRAAAVMTAGSLLAVGCQTASPEVAPDQATLRVPAGSGLVGTADIDRGLKVTLEPDILELSQGQLLTFDCLVNNVGPSAIKLPSSPRVLITCLYPDGTRFFGLPENHDQVLELGSRTLRPGETLRQELLLDTRKLHQLGLVEVRAIFTFAKMNSTDDQDAWLGRALSNGYGFELRENTLLDQAPALSSATP